MLRGFDISAFQSTTVPKADFCFIKATEGKSYKSSRFAAQWANAKKLGVIRGAYHFARPEASSGASQADFFLSVVKPVAGDILILDLEASKLSQAATNKYAKDWANRCKAKHPNNRRVIYMGSGYATNGTGRGLNAYFDFWWYPQYPSTANTHTWKTSFSPWLPKGLTCGWSRPHFWQWTDNFGGIDASISWLTAADLKKTPCTNPQPAPQPIPAPIPKPAPKPSDSSSTTRTKLLANMKADVGTYGPPNNSNKFNDWYYGHHVSGDAYSWCVVFACYHWNKLGILAANGGKFAGVPSFKEHFQKVGSYVGNPTNTSKFEPGDPIAYDLNGNGGGDHFGTVYKVLSSTTFQAIEGNTSGKGNDDVAIKNRSVHQVIGHAKLKGADGASEDDIFMEYISVDKDGKGRREVLADSQWSQVYFNKNNSGDASKHHAAGDYPSFVQGGYRYNGIVELRINGLPKGAEGQIRCIYVDSKGAVQATCYIKEFLGSTGDTFVTLPAVGYVPTGQKARVEVVVYDIGTAQPTVIEGSVRLDAKKV